MNIYFSVLPMWIQTASNPFSWCELKRSNATSSMLEATLTCSRKDSISSTAASYDWDSHCQQPRLVWTFQGPHQWTERESDGENQPWIFTSLIAALISIMPPKIWYCLNFSIFAKELEGTFFKFIFNWRIIALQYWFHFFHTSTWISHRCP